MTTESPFAGLGLRAELAKTVAELGYETPTPIQELTIPVMLRGRDLIGQAQTGTGKTAAFALPLLEKIDPGEQVTQVLILTPTRELAMQVAEAIHTYARGMQHVTILPVYGGAPIVPQLRRLERGVQVVVGTPGRLIDHLERKSLNLASVRLIVLDEADEMLRMGFIDDVEQILAAAPQERQVALFSATMPDEIVRISERHLRDPERIVVEHHSLSAPAIEQRFLNVSESQKLDVLTQILELEPSEAVLVFRRTKNGAAELAERLEGRGFAAVAMHGDMVQSARESVVRRLRAGQIEIVVATDVAARGLDVEQIQHVVNYDIPWDVEAYVHRIGRTGRAGRSGVATLFITPRERRMMREIERFTGTQIKPMKIPTRGDVAARRIAVFKDSVRKAMSEGELDLYLELVEQLSVEGPFDMADIAAACARLASGNRLSGSDAEAREEEAPRPATAAPRTTGERPSRPAERPATARPPRENDDEAKVWLAIGVGKRDGIRPADIVGSIANEADVPGRDIGPIDIRDQLTIVGIPERYRDQVLQKTAGTRFRGRAMNVRVAEERERMAPREGGTYRRREEGAAPRRESPSRPGSTFARREFTPRDDKPRPRREFTPSDDKPRPRREYTPRDDAPRPRREFTPSDDKPRPRREYTPRDEAPRPRRAFTPRDDAPRPRREYTPRTPSSPSREERRPSTGRTSAPRPDGRPPFRKRDDVEGPPRRTFAARKPEGAARRPAGGGFDRPAEPRGFYSGVAKKRRPPVAGGPKKPKKR